MSILDRLFGSNIPETEKLEESATKKIIKGDNEGALADYKKALSISPEKIILHSKIGTLYTSMREHRLAVESFTKAIELTQNINYPTRDFLYYSLGFNLFKLQDNLGALFFGNYLGHATESFSQERIL